MTDVPVGAGNDREPLASSVCNHRSFSATCDECGFQIKYPLPGAGGGHTADSDLLHAALVDWTRDERQFSVSPAAVSAALARLEAAANRTAAEAADAKNAWEYERLMLLRATAAEAERDALRTTSQIRYDDYMAARAEANSLRAEHDAAHARVAELEQALAPLVDGKRNVTNFDLARARAVLGGPE